MSDAQSLLRFEQQGSIARLTLNRPQAGNAIDLPLARELLDAARRCDQDDAIRCVSITGAGRLFCTGGDVSAFAAAGDGVPELLRELAGTLHQALRTLSRLRKPVLTIVNGPAAGAGLSLSACGDIVIAASSAHFTAAYGSVGLTPDGGMSWWLPRLVGLRRAQEIILANRRIAAPEAEALGLVTRVVDDVQLQDEAAAWEKRLSESATRAVGGARLLLVDGYSRTLSEQLDAEVDAIVRAGADAECREGVAAFLDRRRPDFTNAAGQ